MFREMTEIYRTPKDVLCLGCRTKFTVSADEFDSEAKRGTIEEHKFTGMPSIFADKLAKYTCRDCPHCRKVDEAGLGPRPTVAQQMATIRIRRMEFESLGQTRSKATSMAIAEQMAVEDGYASSTWREYLK